ncbi:HNH endonuclease [Deinococcus depolymerans]|uniref:Uncharacterized protein n=1 Tax=Deinococcus depolymerans TaxID=392408 RepID=A0ABN1BU17_9DEIO
MWGRSDSVHFNRSNAALDAALKADPKFAAEMEELIPGVKNAVSRTGGRETPTGWTWHHSDEPGKMQLVPSDDHWGDWKTYHPDGKGGYAKWAIPAGAPCRK